MNGDKVVGSISVKTKKNLNVIHIILGIIEEEEET